MKEMTQGAQGRREWAVKVEMHGPAALLNVRIQKVERGKRSAAFVKTSQAVTVRGKQRREASMLLERPGEQRPRPETHADATHTVDVFDAPNPLPQPQRPQTPREEYQGLLLINGERVERILVAHVPV